jgi:hypothetical protein
VRDRVLKDLKLNQERDKTNHDRLNIDSRELLHEDAHSNTYPLNVSALTSIFCSPKPLLSRDDYESLTGSLANEVEHVTQHAVAS